MYIRDLEKIAKVVEKELGYKVKVVGGPYDKREK